MKSYLFFGTILLSLYSCVSPKIYNQLSADFEKSQQSLINSEKSILNLSNQIEEMKQNINRLKQNLNELRGDSIQNGKSLVSLKQKYQELNTSYELLSSKSSREMGKKAKEIKQLLDQLESTQRDLLVKEDELNNLSLSLSDKETELNKSQRELNKRSRKVEELEKIINQKDSLVSVMKNKISKALTGLEGDGLTIEQRNGKIYISLEEDLLFASGQYEVNQSGKNALDKLSAALASQNNIEILVEGHTDDVPIKSSKLVKDNWDLSVMRATAVVRILLNNDKLNPLKLTAAGRGEYNPIANNETAQGKKMNRRIEMILSPRLDDLYKILEE